MTLRRSIVALGERRLGEDGVQQPRHHGHRRRFELSGFDGALEGVGHHAHAALGLDVASALPAEDTRSLLEQDLRDVGIADRPKPRQAGADQGLERRGPTT